MNKTAQSEISKNLSLKKGIVFLLIYLFSIVPIGSASMYFLLFFGYSMQSISSHLSEGILVYQICITIIMTYHFLHNYGDYLVSNSNRELIFSYLYVGIKWSAPLVIIHILAISIPSIRANIIENYLSMKIITVQGISNFVLIIFSIWILSGAIFEEIIFRGIFLQRIHLHLNKTLAIFLAAGLFTISHYALSVTKIGYLISIFIVGLLSGFAYTSSGSIISAIVPHLLNNILCIAFIMIIR